MKTFPPSQGVTLVRHVCDTAGRAIPRPDYSISSRRTLLSCGGLSTNSWCLQQFKMPLYASPWNYEDETLCLKSLKKSLFRLCRLL